MGSPILYSSAKRSQFFVIANFGTDTIGKNERKISSHIKNFGYRKLNGIWSEMPK